ncbi:Hypothetical predicted protein [Lecanosticta acicola]|uniref:Uncharacterized protein n=1 Tax=Lecanosticta acicola TaxID=111012 RepID=A0AAI8Z6Y5_9PEZI|nr:Hypothetical predicted protein [Lecanosticta acicola]
MHPPHLRMLGLADQKNTTAISAASSPGSSNSQNDQGNAPSGDMRENATKNTNAGTPSHLASSKAVTNSSTPQSAPSGETKRYTPRSSSSLALNRGNAQWFSPSTLSQGRTTSGPNARESAILTFKTQAEDLQTRLNAAEARCSQLEAKNANLETENAKLKAASNIHPHSSAASDSPGRRRGRSTTRRVELVAPDEPPGGDAAPPASHSSSEIPIEEKMPIVELILKELSNRVERLESTVKRPGDNDEQAIRIDNLDNAHRELELRANQLHEQIEVLLTRQSNIYEKLNRASDGPTPKSASPQDSNDGSVITKVDRLERRLNRKERQKTLIDEAFTAEQLQSYYERLCLAIENDEEDMEFEGDLDELCSLRNRCILRMAEFAPFHEALQKAQADRKYNGNW